MKFNDLYNQLLSENSNYTSLESILPTLEFMQTTKQPKKYTYVDSVENMPPMSYAVAKQQQPVVTYTADGKETQNVAEPQDIIMSGPSKEHMW
jgi:hypothetical protein